MKEMKQAKEIYKSIKAPDELRSKVLLRCEAKAERRNRLISFRRAALPAVCLVLLVTALAVTQLFRSPSVYCNGQKIGAEPVTVSSADVDIGEPALARTAASVSFRLEFDAASDTEVAVGAGRLVYSDQSGAERVYITTEAVFSGKFYATWEIDFSELSDKAELTVSSMLQTHTYTLTSDKNGEYYLAKEEK